MTPGDFNRILVRLIKAGWAEDDIAWAENIQRPSCPVEFAQETIFVICNSGMRFLVATKIYERVMDAIMAGASASTAFGHKGKAAAIDLIWRDRERLMAEFLAAEDPVAYCETIPWIGGITKYHLAKNFGAQVAKPDVHLQRLADVYGVTAQQLCERLAGETGYRVATIDTLIWRACAVGILDGHTGQIIPETVQ
jgi:hypothetical protein